jgi:DtxR family transcriptional regulator, Mn-dependent transcriptional regulator
MRSESVEDYLKTIYLIQEEQNDSPVSTTSLAARLGVANSSVTGMLKHISSLEPKLVDYEPYYGVRLSPEGLKTAREITRHHRLIESYLSEKLGYSWDEVHAEAERLEHVISEEMEERMAIALGNPATDPHGDPIPDRNGLFTQVDYISLAKIPAGQPGEIRRIIGQEPDLLRYLTSQGLVLSTRLIVESRAPFNGPINIRMIGTSETQKTLGREVAEKIMIMPLTVAAMENAYEQYNDS